MDTELHNDLQDTIDSIIPRLDYMYNKLEELEYRIVKLEDYNRGFKD